MKNQFQILLCPCNEATVEKKAKFLSLARILTANGFLRLEGWTDTCVHDVEKSAGIWYSAANFNQCARESYAAEQFLRGCSHAIN